MNRGSTTLARHGRIQAFEIRNSIALELSNGNPEKTSGHPKERKKVKSTLSYQDGFQCQQFPGRTSYRPLKETIADVDTAERYGNALDPNCCLRKESIKRERLQIVSDITNVIVPSDKTNENSDIHVHGYNYAYAPRKN